MPQNGVERLCSDSCPHAEPVAGHRRRGLEILIPILGCGWYHRTGGVESPMVHQREGKPRPFEMGHPYIAAWNFPAGTAPLGTGEMGALYRRISLRIHNVNNNPKTAMSALSGIPAGAEEEEGCQIARNLLVCNVCKLNSHYIV